MKAEFLQHYYDAHGVPFRTRMVGNFTKSQQLASAMPNLYNFIISNKFTGNLTKKVLGFAPERSLPKLGNSTLRSWFKQFKKETAQYYQAAAHRKKVYLFCDEFTNYNDVEIGITAVKLLTALGYTVEIPKHEESGRTYLSKGLVRQAKQIAIRNVKALSTAMTDNIPLIGIEPSAILTLRDEYLDLISPDLAPAAQRIAKNTFLLEEFLWQEVEKGNIRQEQFTQQQQHIKLHGHCYQKAFHVLSTTQKILSFPENYTVEMIPSGCCGMAGSFGYEKEHYEVSMNIGELVLFPAVRQTPENVLIAAAGTSCRHQIKDGTTRIAQHPVEILYQALKIKIR
jgi:Fe-S oxidoreductase